MQTLQLTKAPIIASHSAVRKLCDNSRNMDDEQLLALKKNGGVIQIVAFNAYVKTPPPDSPERAAALDAVSARSSTSRPARRSAAGEDAARRGARRRHAVAGAVAQPLTSNVRRSTKRAGRDQRHSSRRRRARRSRTSSTTSTTP